MPLYFPFAGITIGGGARKEGYRASADDEDIEGEAGGRGGRLEEGTIERAGGIGWSAVATGRGGDGEGIEGGIWTG